MRTEQIQIYHFDELSDEAKEHAVETFREGIDEIWDWEGENDMLIDSFMRQAEEYGFSFGDRPSFQWECYSQGSYLNFEFNDIDIDKLFKKKGWGWKDMRMLHSIWKESQVSVDCDVQFRCCGDRSIYIAVTIDDYDYPRGDSKQQGSRWDNRVETLDRQAEELGDALQEVYDELCKMFHNQVYETYEYVGNDENIIETIRANEYEFTKEGDRY